MKYIVTGGAGFIGSHITDSLIKEGHEVVIIDDLSSGKKENINLKAQFHKLDITDEKSIDPFFKGAAGVFHLGALARIQPSFENPDLFFRVNAIGTRNILALAKKYGVKRVIYSASSSAYGPDVSLPLKEDFKLNAQALHPYGSTKRIGEMLMRDMGRMTGGPETVCLRYFNVYGPRQTSASDGPYATVVGIFWEMARQGKSLPIVPDGHQRRDFTNVRDVAAANLLAMTSSKVGDAEIINIGTNTNYSVWDVARLILQLPLDTDTEELLKSKKCIMLPPRRGEVRETLANVSLAKELLGWEPKVHFEAGIKEILDL